MREREHSLSCQARQTFGIVDRYRQPGPLLLVISGPSGVGKDSVVRRLCETDPSLHFIVTATDRPARPGEVDGVDYHFVSTARFEEMISAGELFEHARVYGQYKGVPKESARRAMASGKDVIMRLDVQGAATVLRVIPQAVSIFLLPPSLDVLMQRLSARASDSPRQVAQRLQTAMNEMERLGEFGYAVVNEQDALDRAVETIRAIMVAEKCRVCRQELALGGDHDE